MRWFSKPCSSLLSVEENKSSTTATEENVTEEVVAKLLRHNATTKKAPPRSQVFFPWHHNEADIWESLNFVPTSFGDFVFQRNTMINNLKLQIFKSVYTKIIAMTFLDNKWQDVLLSQKWEKDFTDSCSWAFSRGAAGIISNAYDVKFNSIYQTTSDSKIDFDLDFQYKPTPLCTDDKSSPSPDINNETHEKNKINNNDDEKKRDDVCTGESDKIDEEKNNDLLSKEIVKTMLEKNLCELYKSSHQHGKDSLLVTLKTQPTSASLCGFFAFPYLSRKHVEERPSRWDEYMDIINGGVQNVFIKLMNHIDKMDVEGKGLFETTVVALVAISCDEVFMVTDTSSSPILLQGHGDLKVRKVVHYVQFERNVTLQLNQGDDSAVQFQYGNWQISDIDGLLNGNRWK